MFGRQALLGQLSLGNVHRHPQHARRASAGIANHIAPAGKPPDVTIRRAGTVFAFIPGRSFDCLSRGVLHPVHVIGVDELEEACVGHAKAPAGEPEERLFPPRPEVFSREQISFPGPHAGRVQRQLQPRFSRKPRCCILDVVGGKLIGLHSPDLQTTLPNRIGNFMGR